MKLAAQILANNVGSAASSGLFLAAPRRTGKSTFMREDLRPALEQSGAHVLYVDLWSNRATDPGDLMRNEGLLSMVPELLAAVSFRVNLVSASSRTRSSAAVS